MTMTAVARPGRWKMLVGATAATMAMLMLMPGVVDAREFPKPQRVADGVYVLEGAREHFSRENDGDIVNTGFIDTPAGVVVIDTGPSFRYGRAQRAAAKAVTGHEVIHAYVTHAHPDHFLGGQAYVGVPVQALKPTVKRIARDGEDLAQNLYLLVGGAMTGTVAVAPAALPGSDAPAQSSTRPTTVEFGGRRLQLLGLDGHTDADLVVFDEQTGTLFAGDLVFFERAPTTPDADIGRWLAALDRLDSMPYKVLVPGHGPIVRGPEAIRQTRDYLNWVRETLKAAADQGLDMNEVMRLKAPERLARLAVLEAEWQRTVMHLYPKVEADSLKKISD